MRASMPALDRLAPITVTARDAHGATIFYTSTTLPRLSAAGLRMELRQQGAPFDPYRDEGPFAN